MTKQIPVNIAVEDSLSEAVLQRILNRCGRQYLIGNTFKRGGSGYLKTNILAFNKAAQRIPFFLLTDLDSMECPIRLINDWLPVSRHPNLIFRVAVREVESWLLADRDNFARYFGIQKSKIPLNPDNEYDPKLTVINSMRRSKKRKFIKDIVPPQHSKRRQGPNYNGRLIEFVRTRWEPSIARNSSDSLNRALRNLELFQPNW